MDHCHASDVRSLLNSASRLTLNWRAKSLIAVDGERKSWPAVAGYDEREPTGAASRNGAKNGATGSAVPDADHTWWSRTIEDGRGRGNLRHRSGGCGDRARRQSRLRPHRCYAKEMRR